VEFANVHTLTTINVSPTDNVQLRASCLGPWRAGRTRASRATPSAAKTTPSALTVSQAGMTVTNATVFTLGTYNRQDETVIAGAGTVTIDWKIASSGGRRVRACSSSSSQPGPRPAS